MNKLISKLTEFFVILSILFSTVSIGYVAYIFYTKQIYFSEIYSNTCVLIQEALNQQDHDAISTNAPDKEKPNKDNTKIDSDFIDEQVEHLTRLQELEENTMTMDLMVFIYGFLSSVFVSVGAYYTKKIKEESNKTQEMYNTATANLNTSQSNLNKARSKMEDSKKNFSNAKNELSLAKKTYSETEDKFKNVETKIENTEKNISEIKNELETQKNSFEKTKAIMDDIITDCTTKQKAIGDFHTNIQHMYEKIPYYDTLQTANLVLTICFQCEKLNCNNDIEKSILAKMLPRFNDTMKFLLDSVKKIEKENINLNETDVIKFVLTEISKSIDRCSKLNQVFFSEKYVKKLKDEIKECSIIISHHKIV